MARKITNARPRHVPAPLNPTPAHQLATGDEIVWIDGTTTTVRAADDDETTTVYLALTNGRHQAVRRTRRFNVVNRHAAAMHPQPAASLPAAVA